MNRVRRMRRIAMHKLACIFRERKRRTSIFSMPRAGGDPLGRRKRKGVARPARTGLESEPGNPRSHPDPNGFLFLYG